METIYSTADCCNLDGVFKFRNLPLEKPVSLKPVRLVIFDEISVHQYSMSYYWRANFIRPQTPFSLLLSTLRRGRRQQHCQPVGTICKRTLTWASGVSHLPSNGSLMQKGKTLNFYDLIKKFTKNSNRTLQQQFFKDKIVIDSFAILKPKFFLLFSIKKFADSSASSSWSAMKKKQLCKLNFIKK